MVALVVVKAAEFPYRPRKLLRTVINVQVHRISHRPMQSLQFAHRLGVARSSVDGANVPALKPLPMVVRHTARDAAMRRKSKSHCPLKDLHRISKPNGNPSASGAARNATCYLAPGRRDTYHTPAGRTPRNRPVIGRAPSPCLNNAGEIV